MIWPNNRRCALSLTYDDALPVHQELVAGALGKRGLKGTFYALISGDVMNNPAAWRQIAGEGHELGNHTLFHPCRKDPPEKFPWLDDGFDLRTYTPYRMFMELKLANFVLSMIDGKQERTYGNTCADLFVGDDTAKVAIADIVRKEFIAARGPITNHPAIINGKTDFMTIGCCIADGRSLRDLKDQILDARQKGGWITYAMHGVGAGTNDLYIDYDVHERLLDWLTGETDIWVAPFIEVAKWARTITNSERDAG